MRDGIKEAIVVDSENASGYGQFANESLYADKLFIVHFFNITNAPDILASPDVKPALEEVGPFIYKRHSIRSDTVFSKAADTVSFRLRSWIEFDAEATSIATKGRHKSDTEAVITTINMLFLGMRVQAGRSYWHLICDHLLWKSDFKRLFEHRTPRELLAGYTVNIKLPLLPAIPIAFPGLQPNLPVDQDPDMIHRSTIRMGASNLNEAFRFVNWREQAEAAAICPYGSLHLPLDKQCKEEPYPCCGQKDPVPVWDQSPAVGEFDSDANAVLGTTGDQFRPGLHRPKEQVEVWFDLTQRAVPFVTHEGEPNFEYHGISLRTFRPDSTMFWGNAKDRDANRRYYQWGPSGLANLSVLFGADVFASLPHFLNADASLLDGVTGLNPDPSLHDLFLGVEPYTGMTMVEQQRAMISAKIQAESNAAGSGKWFPTLGDRQIFVPVAWFNDQSFVTADGASQLSDLNFAVAVKPVLQWIGIGLGVLGVVLAGIFLAVCSPRCPLQSSRRLVADGLLEAEEQGSSTESANQR